MQQLLFCLFTNMLIPSWVSRETGGTLGKLGDEDALFFIHKNSQKDALIR